MVLKVIKVVKKGTETFFQNNHFSFTLFPLFLYSRFCLLGCVCLLQIFIFNTIVTHKGNRRLNFYAS